MIQSNFYPTDTQITPDIELTDHLLDIPRFTDSMADAYLMGYIPANKMPAAFMPVYLSGGVGEMSAIYHPKNTGWGYGWLDLNSDQRYATSFTRVNGSIVARPDFRTQYRLFNAIKMARANTGMQITITYILAFIDNAVYDGEGGTTDFVQGGLYAGGWGQTTRQVTYTFDQFVDIIKNDLPLFSITETGNTGVINGKSYTFAPRPSEFGDSNDSTVDHKWVKDSGQGAQAVVMIDGYQINSAMNYANGNGGGTTYYLRPFTYTDIDAVGDFAATKAMLFPAELSNMSQRLTWSYDKNTRIFQLVPGNTQTYTIADYNINPGGFNFGTITDSDADFTNTTYPTRELLVKKSIWMNANRFGTITGGTIQNIYTPMDVYRHALLYHKHTTDGSQTGYGTDNTWTTRFDASNAPTGEILTGSYSSIVSSLRPWQLPDVDISTNDFTPEDVPGSDPESEKEETGDSIIRPSSIVVGSTSGFLTQYVLNAANVSALGAALWSGIGDANFWQNVLWTTLTASASFDVSSLLQYFISLRVYPFPLVNISTYAGTGDNKIRIGRGAVPLTLGSTPNVGTISQYADILDAGTVQVPAYYGDFRDYAQTDVILHAPYIGTVNLAAADVIGATLHLVYAIDFAAGSCTAYLDISRGGFTYPVCLGSGVIGADVPLTADSASRRAAALFGLGDAALSNIGQNASAERGAEGELDLEVNPYGMLAGAARGILGANPIAPTMSGIGKGFDSFAGAQTAYIQIRRAITKNPGNQDKTYGRQTAKSARLGDLSGFTICQNVDVSGLDCDLETKTQIKRLLETGVYI